MDQIPGGNATASKMPEALVSTVLCVGGAVGHGDSRAGDQTSGRIAYRSGDFC